VLLTDCEFIGNSATYGGGVYIRSNCSTTFERCLFEGNTVSHSGGAVTCWDSDATLSCCDVYGNAGGDWVGCLEDQYGIDGNICEDPLFCSGANPDEPYTLRDDSPCAAGNNPSCGQIGAWGVGCGATPAEPARWGPIKARFR
jgi:predicted outer membrane repeat protein